VAIGRTRWRAVRLTSATGETTTKSTPPASTISTICSMLSNCTTSTRRPSRYVER